MIMKMEAQKNTDDRGYTLVELVAVIAIMVVMVGVLTLSMNIVFNEDSQRAANLVEDELKEARMLAMSKSGDIVMKIHTEDSNPKGYKIEITKGGTVYRSVSVDVSVLISLTSNGTPVSGAGEDISVEFNKSNGSIKKINGSAPVTDKTYEIVAVAQRGSGNTAKVIIAPNTGRHYVEKN